MSSPSAERRQSLQSLERGMSVIQVFSGERPAMTLSEVARLAGTSRATARRILLTLEELGHVRADGRLFSLTPRILRLGEAYLSSLNLPEVARPLMEELVGRTRQACSVATLDLPEIVYLARVTPSQITTLALGVGSRLPAHATSMGRVLLADLAPASLALYLQDAPFERHTSRTMIQAECLEAGVEQARIQGWALVDRELEEDLRSIAAPIRGANGHTVAALNTAAAASKVSREELRSELLPALLETAKAISRGLASAAGAQQTLS